MLKLVKWNEYAIRFGVRKANSKFKNTKKYPKVTRLFSVMISNLNRLPLHALLKKPQLQQNC